MMNTFPVDFTPDNVLNAKKLRREKRRREKIEREKCAFRAAIVEKVTQENEDMQVDGTEETWWWKVDVDKRWEESTFEEIQNELRVQQWLIQQFPHYESAIVCSRRPNDEEVKHFFD